MKKKGYFFALEGIDGSGKSSLVKLLDKKFEENNIPCYMTREPTDSPIGSIIREFMTGKINIDHRAIAAMFVADRIEHLTNSTNGIVQALDKGITVISDRYYFSSYAYNSIYADMDWVINANKICSDIQKPDLNIFIDTSPEVCVGRLEKDRLFKERYEELDNLKRVRDNYLTAIEKLKSEEKVAIIDGNMPLAEVEDKVWNLIKQAMST